MINSKLSILIVGYFGFENAGDEAILAVTIKELLNRIPNSQITVVSGSPEKTKRSHSVNSISWINFSKIIDAVKNCDLVILGGGGLFHDYENFNKDTILTRNYSGISFYSTFPILAALLNKPIFLNGIGVGPIFTNEGKEYTKLCFELSWLGTVRDLESLNQIKKLNVNNKIEVTTDIAFSLNITPKNKIKEILLKEGFNNFDKIILGVSVRNWDYQIKNEEWENELATGLDEFISKHHAKIIFVPFQQLENPNENDLVVSKRIMEKMKNREESILIKGRYTPNDLAGIFYFCDAVLSMRLHSAIFAAKTLTPIIGLVYDPKIQNIMRQLNCEEYSIEIKSLNSYNLVSILSKAIKEKENIITKLKSSLPTLTKLSQKNFEYIIKLLDNKEAYSINHSHRFMKNLEKISLSLAYQLDKETNLKNEFHQQLLDQNKVITEKNQVITNKDKEITEKDKFTEQITNLQNANANYQKMIIDIHQSFVFRMLHKYDRTIGKVLSLRPKKYAQSTEVQSSEKEQSIQKEIAKKKVNLEKKDIICFPIINWDYRYQRSQHIMTKFSENGHRVFYLTVNLRKLSRPYEIKELANDVYQIELNSPKFFDIYKDKFNKALIFSLVNSFRKLKEELNLDAIIFVQFPTWAPFVQELKNQFGYKMVFDCLDDFTGFSNVIKERENEEKILLENSDLVLATSSYLMKKVMGKTKKNLFLPNAGEFNHFNNPPYSDLLQNYNKPIVGYFGSIAEWFDTKLIEFLAKKRTQYTFILIGYTYGSDIRKLNEMKNVHFLGERPYSELPEYLRNFDVCIIPFKNSPLIESTHPVKIYEYLSAGKPVVATKIPELIPISDLCYLASNHEEFLSCLDKALMEKDENLIKKRIHFASQNTWQHRFEKLYQKLNENPSFDIQHHD